MFYLYFRIFDLDREKGDFESQKNTELDSMRKELEEMTEK